jgi:dienelactone hydrolase
MGPGYRVYVPVLYGDFGKSCSALGGSLAALSRGWQLVGTGDRDPRVLPALRSLCAFLSTQNHHGRPLQVIGNCMTGGSAIALLGDPHVCAAIASQPAYPMWPGRQLDIAPQTLERATARAANLRPPAILAFRYRRDRVCRQPRFDRLAAAFERKQIDLVELCEPGEAHARCTRPLPTPNSKQHSVLIPVEDPSVLAANAASRPALLENVARFLQRHRQ